MTTLRDEARAKLNLTLQVLGRRADGYHELCSLVAFAELGDTVELKPGKGVDLIVEGPFAQGLEVGGNLVLAAADAAKTVIPSLQLGRFRLFKNLPVAAGLGGGSADAAAALRLLARANGGVLTDAALAVLAASLGSDVRACLASEPALMSGRGEKVHRVHNFPSCAVVLANPGTALATADVYAALHAPALPQQAQAPPDMPDFAGRFERLLDYAGPLGNDLQAPAIALVPAITGVLGALAAQPEARLVRLSGSGPTCFALFADVEAARRAAASLATAHPHWWVAASTLA
jgi:4-diphosphocytidyl-2-C-methyl-D-erythritol kinase